MARVAAFGVVLDAADLEAAISAVPSDRHRSDERVQC
ncbi:hypothetical protein BN11_830019 [Nostocoides australiense Ben110]|uniref:Uncharacterized protein n=1 Tax=Nostocoides australiense Ben110 TaxID=1193182 RepID=W6K331_9MICO|nr:hypothetical protein BN11_830019 [Tetrasphaera australiensis Ben110]